MTVESVKERIRLLCFKILSRVNEASAEDLNSLLELLDYVVSTQIRDEGSEEEPTE